MKLAHPSHDTADQLQMQHNKIRIGILGAGPAGLMAALALEYYLPKDQVSITILDRNKSETDYPGVEYGIQERACRALERINQLEPALSRGNPCHEITFYNARLQKRFRSIQSDPQYTRAVVRQEFLADLAKLLQQTKIERQHFATTITPSGDGTVIVEGKLGKEERKFSKCFDLLIAADGIQSVVRKSIFPEAAVIHERGFSCIYMLVEADQKNAPPGFLDRANGGRSELIMGSISTMTMFPLGKGRLALGIGFDDEVKSAIWQKHGVPKNTEWSAISATQKKAIAVQLTSDADRQDGNLVKALDLIPDWNSYKIYNWAMRDADPLPKPFIDGKNIMVIGDAAHAIMPTIGMGASLAIEDAELLARQIADMVKKTPTAIEFRYQLSEQVFEPFTALRYPVWKELIGRARAAAIGNFIRVEKRKRFSIGPQIPNNTLSRIVSRIEWLMEKLGL